MTVSYLFYGWWDWRFLCLIAITTLCSWVSGLLTERYRQHGSVAFLVTTLNVVLNLVILGIFKYYNFFAASFADLFMGGDTDGILLEIILPVGISFYTFQALSYTIDVYRGKIVPTGDIVAFFAFVSFFPQLVAGHIERATNLLPQFQSRRSFSYDKAVVGCRQMLWGLFKKVIIADNCALFVNQVYASPDMQYGSTLLLAAIFFTFQIYGDFSGYSDIAIGASRLFGITLMRNFNVPYFSRDIAEFWRRWHISLTTWFRDYLYIPLGGSRCSRWCVVRNTFVIFLVSGLWHGANWTFVAWGAYHALLFLPLILMGSNRRYRDIVASDRIVPNLRESVQMLVTFFLVVIGWVLFRAETMHQAFGILGGMADLETLCAFSRMVLDPEVRPTALFVLAMLVVEWFTRRQDHGLSFCDRLP